METAAPKFADGCTATAADEPLNHPQMPGPQTTLTFSPMK
jgi:hypothetical protein